MFGLLSTLQVGAGSQLVPVGCPLAMVPVEDVEDLRFGLIAPADEPARAAPPTQAATIASHSGVPARTLGTSPGSPPTR